MIFFSLSLSHLPTEKPVPDLPVLHAQGVARTIWSHTRIRHTTLAFFHNSTQSFNKMSSASKSVFTNFHSNQNQSLDTFILEGLFKSFQFKIKMAVDSQRNIFYSHNDWSSAELSCLFLVSSVPPGSRSVDGCQSLSALWCPLPTTLSSINCSTLLSPHPHTPTTCRLISIFQIPWQLFL